MESASPSFSRYLPQSERSRAWQLWCTTAGRVSVAKDSPYPPVAGEHPPQYATILRGGRVLDEYQLVYITRGRGYLTEANGKRHEVRAGAMLLVFPGIRHAYGPNRDTGWDEQWVGFRGPLADQLFAQEFFAPDKPVLDPGLRPDLVHDYAELISIARSELPGYQFELAAIVYRLLSRLACIAERREQHSRAEELASRARAWMEARVESSLEVEDLARDLGLTYENFRRIFLRYTGLAPYRYFLQLKMARAKTLLDSERLSIKEVAERLAFQNQYYFSRSFKSHIGQSPTEWRNKRG